MPSPFRQPETKTSIRPSWKATTRLHRQHRFPSHGLRAKTRFRLSGRCRIFPRRKNKALSHCLYIRCRLPHKAHALPSQSDRERRAPAFLSPRSPDKALWPCLPKFLRHASPQSHRPASACLRFPPESSASGARRRNAPTTRSYPSTRNRANLCILN